MRTVIGIFILMGIAVMVYLFLTGAFMNGNWVFLENLMSEIDVSVHNFALFISVSIIFLGIIIIPLVIVVLRSL